MRIQTATRGLLAAAILSLLGPEGSGAEPASSPRPLSESARHFRVPDGFRVTLFAGEPDVRQPIAFAIDVRGRLWVVECFSYPAWKQPPTEKDRILIFEDTDGDGRFDRRKVFWDEGNNLTGLALGFGGVWVCATPNLLFIPDADGDDVPDGPPVVKLDGWDTKAQHNLVNGLNWGPDGWLYGCNGILSNSLVGKPGAPASGRTVLNCGVWRYHPTREAFEAVAHGTTNPWGLDFDDRGEAFITNCVIPHLFHVVPGAHFQRMFGQDINPYSFGLIPSCADHLHWGGGEWQSSRGGLGKHGEAGGGHAHVGAMIYLGDNWPDRYRGAVFMCNLHGKRVNCDRLERRGSTYVATHRRDFLFADDDWYRGLELKYGPDGGVYLTDWSDVGECHDTDADGAHRENGRIYKITFGQTPPTRVDLGALDSEALARLQSHKNEWYVRNARRLLQERAARGADLAGAERLLAEMFEQQSQEPEKLRALWALHATGYTVRNPRFLPGLIAHELPAVRGWAVRLLAQEPEIAPSVRERWAEMAASDPSPYVRLCLASALQRLPLPARWPIAQALVAVGDDARDPYLPLMIWYGVEGLAGADPVRAVELAATARIPVVRQYLARRIVLADDQGRDKDHAGLSSLVRRLGEGLGPEAERDWLAGMLDALEGRKDVAGPSGWPAVAARLAAGPSREVREQSLRLGLIFGDPQAAAILGATIDDGSAPLADRERAIRALAERHAPGLESRLLRLLGGEKDLRRSALRALAGYPDPAVGAAILAAYSGFDAPERADAVATLAARPESALALLGAMEKGVVSRRDLSVGMARQLLAFGDRRVAETLERVWGTIRPTAAAKAGLIARYKTELNPARLKEADLARGRDVFGRACAQCHRLFGSGAEIGPDLTGSDRANLDYILENVLDPSATVAREYRLTNVATTDGRLISGLLAGQSEATVTIRTVNDRIVLPREEVEEVMPSNASLMPEGLLETLSADEVRDLVGYLGAKSPPAGDSRGASGR